MTVGANRRSFLLPDRRAAERGVDSKPCAEDSLPVLSFLGHRAQLRAAVETMIAWQPARVILAHGRWYASDGVKELRRAFRWLLD